MDDEKRERYRRRRAARANRSDGAAGAVADEALVARIQNQPLEAALVNAMVESMEQRYHVDPSASAPPGEAERLLAEIKQGLDDEKISLLLDSCRDSVLDAVIRPFGLSTALFADKEGGNVTTLHNFAKAEPVTATAEDAARLAGYQDDFDRREYESRDFKRRRRDLVKGDAPLTDAYTGKELPRDGRAQLDHVVSAHEIDQDPRAHLFLSQEERVQMANADSNLVMTERSANQSKSDKQMDEWLNTKSRAGQTPEERYGVDREKATAIDQESRRQMNRQLRRAQVKKQGSELLRTGASEGLRMGLQQSLGLLLREFVVAVFAEARDIFRHGFKGGKPDASFWSVLKERLTRVATRVISRWKDVVSAFRDGAISGFFSNLVTFLINSLLTTTARVGRMIREGFFSLLRAFKMLLFPPPGLTRRQAAHEASRLLGAAIVTSAGIMLEELVERFLQSIPVLGPVAGLVAPVIMGILTGLSISLVVYLIDKVDLLGVVAAERHERLITQLDGMIGELLETAEATQAVFALPTVDV